MVIHDDARMQEWVQEKTVRRERRKPSFHLSVMAVQCMACCVILLLALLLRVAGGEAYETLRQEYQQALARNEWITAMSQLWDDRPLENADITVHQDVKEDDFTREETAQLTYSPMAVSPAPPLESGTLTSAYGYRIHPIYGGEEFHNGVDIAAPSGSVLMAMYDGVIVEVGENDTLGRFLRIEHGGGVEVLYGHCERVVTQQGETVKAGDVVALVGSTGVSTGSHVHLGVTVDSEQRDPASLISLERYA